MQFGLSKIKDAFLAGYHSLFEGRISRATFLIRVVILATAVVILVAPMTTILAPSTKTLRDVYITISLAIIGLCLVGFASAYLKRLHDIGLRGYWAIIFIFALPLLIVQGGEIYADYRYRLDRTADLSGAFDLLFIAALALPFLIAMWRGEKSANKFGPLPVQIEHIGGSKLNVAALLGTAAILIPTCVYAGLFQSGVWVGRSESPPPMPMLASNTAGTPFMKCWNVEGVGAGSGKGAASGIYRDGYDGTVFDFIITPEGKIDIATAGNILGMSYLADGFRIESFGLKTPEDGSNYVDVRGLDRFMLVAIFDKGGPSATVNYTTFAFGKNKDGWPKYHVVVSSAFNSSSALGDLAIFPAARGRLMIGDCTPV